MLNRKNKRPTFLPLVGKPAEIKTPSNPEGLDRVAPYQNQIITAVGRELLGFIWAIGVSVEKQHQVTAAA